MTHPQACSFSGREKRDLLECRPSELNALLMGEGLVAVPGSGAVLEARLSQLFEIEGFPLKANISGTPCGSFSCPLAPPGGNAVHHHRGQKKGVCRSGPSKTG